MEEINYANDLLSMLGEWQKLETLVERSIGGWLRLLDYEGNLLVGEETLPPFCALVRRTEEGVSRCQKSYAQVCSQKGATNGGIFRCHAGLSNLPLPINYEGNVLGFIVAGGVFAKEAHQRQANKLLQELHLQRSDGKEKMGQIKHLPESEFRGIARIMQDIVSPFVTSLLRHEHLAQIEQKLRSQLRLGTDGFIFDELTGVFNSNYLFDRLKKEISRARRYQETMSILVLEIENLPGINQDYGHQMGDVVLKEIAEILKCHARESETIARLSTRFVVILPSTDQKSAAKPLQRLRKIINDHSYQLGEEKLAFLPKVLMGVAEYDSQIKDGEELLARAVANFA